MAVAIDVFHNDEHHVWAGAVRDHTDTNASGETLPQMLGYMAVAWNRDNPAEPVTADGFELTLLVDRPDWA